MKKSFEGMSRRQAVATIGAGGAALLGPSVAAQTPMTPLTAEERANIALIDDFIAAWNAKDPAKVMSFFAADARFAVGPIGKTPAFRPPDFAGMIQGAQSITMKVTPETTWARGPVVTHERTDEIVLSPERRITGKYVAVFTLRAGTIVDFIDFEV